MNNVYTFSFPSHGNKETGFLTVYEKNTGMPFEIKRVYTVTQCAPNRIRGYHAHKTLEQVFIALQGTIRVSCESLEGEQIIIDLKDPGQALYCGKEIWHTVEYGENAILLVLAAAEYDEKDYIRDYQEFKERRNQQ